MGIDFRRFAAATELQAAPESGAGQPPNCSYCGSTEFEPGEDNGRALRAKCAACGGTMVSSDGAYWQPDLIGQQDNHPKQNGDPASGGVPGVWAPILRREDLSDHRTRLAMPSRKHTPPEGLTMRVRHHTEDDEDPDDFFDHDSRRPGWNHHTLEARLPGFVGKPSGMIDYSTRDDDKPTLTVHFMHVRKNDRSQGIASAMQDHLRALHPEHMIDHGSRSGDGHAWAQQYADPGDPRLDLDHPDNVHAWPQHVSAVDWCRHRHAERCWLPRQVPDSGVALYQPQDRGLCPWVTASQQQINCPVSEPGPMAAMTMAGARQGLPEDAEFHFTPAQADRRSDHHELAMHSRGGEVGKLTWGHDGDISGVDTDHRHRRRGIGTALYTKAHELSRQHGIEPPNQSVFQTGDGHAFRQHFDAMGDRPDVSHIETHLHRGKGENDTSLHDHLIEHHYPGSADMVRGYNDETAQRVHDKITQFDPCGWQKQSSSGMGHRRAGMFGPLDLLDDVAVPAQDLVTGSRVSNDVGVVPVRADGRFPVRSAVASRVVDQQRANVVEAAFCAGEGEWSDGLHGFEPQLVGSGGGVSRMAGFAPGGEPVGLLLVPEEVAGGQGAMAMTAGLHSDSTDVHEFGFHVVATWAEVRDKAKRIRSEGGVNVLVASGEGVGGNVRGDTAVYETQLNYVPGSSKVGFWTCGCAWGAYAWGRSAAYRRFEGRMCSHALAMQFEAQARGMFGRTVVEDDAKPSWLRARTPIQVEYDRDTGRGVTRRAVPRRNSRHTYEGSLESERFARNVMEHYEALQRGENPYVEGHGLDLMHPPVYAFAVDALAHGADPSEAMGLMLRAGLPHAAALRSLTDAMMDPQAQPDPRVVAARTEALRAASAGLAEQRCPTCHGLGSTEQENADAEYDENGAPLPGHTHQEPCEDCGGTGMQSAVGDDELASQHQQARSAFEQRFVDHAAKYHAHGEGVGAGCTPRWCPMLRQAARRGDDDVWWHGTPTGDLRGGRSGLHVGTHEAATQAVTARIGHPVHGSWDGTRTYGETLLAGKNTLRERGIYPTGHNCGVPDHDHLPDPSGHFPHNSHVTMDSKPDIFPLHITGPMGNHPRNPLRDSHANHAMQRTLEDGDGGHGYFYRNVGEDPGSVSAVLPSSEHIERIGRNSPGRDYRSSDRYHQPLKDSDYDFDEDQDDEWHHHGAKAEPEDDGPTHAGLVLKAQDTGRVLMLQRSLEDEDDPARGTWEFPGGGIEPGDSSSLHGAAREFAEEIGQRVPHGGTLQHVWRSGPYVGHVMVIPREDQVTLHDGRVVPNPDDPKGDHAEQAAWWDPEHARKNPALRPECKTSPWKQIKEASRGKTAATEDDEPGPYYHGTRYKLRAGQVLTGGHMTSNQGYGTPGAHVYYSTRPEIAGHFAEAADGPEDDYNAEPRIYHVEPIHGHEPDPDEHPKFGSFRAKKVRVIRRIGMHYYRPNDHEGSRSGLEQIWREADFAAQDPLGDFAADPPAQRPNTVPGDQENPGSTGFATAADPPAFDGADARSMRMPDMSTFGAAEHPAPPSIADMAREYLRTGELHDPEAALPATTADEDDGWSTDVDPAHQHIPSTPTGGRQDPRDAMQPEINPLEDMAPNSVHANKTVEQIVAEFQRTAGAAALAADSGSRAGVTGSTTNPSDADIAQAAKAHLAKLGMKEFPFAEQQELINEGVHGERARNFGDLRIEGTHYEALNDALAEQDRISGDTEILFV